MGCGILSPESDRYFYVPDKYIPRFSNGERWNFETTGGAFSVDIKSITRGEYRNKKDSHYEIYDRYTITMESDSLPVRFITSVEFESGGGSAILSSPGSYFSFYFRFGTEYTDTVSGITLNDLLKCSNTADSGALMSNNLYSVSRGLVGFTDSSGRVWRRRF